MKKILQDLNSGQTNLLDLPIPQNSPSNLLIQTSRSLISQGTEKMIIDFGKSNYFGKLVNQSERIPEVINKIKTDGLSSTIDAVYSKLNTPIELGYSNVGRVIEVGRDINGYQVGDRVVSNGSHAEIVSVPKNLCCKIPDGVDDDTASFTVLGAISLQGIRLANISLGERVVVIGLGTIGLLTLQILLGQSCQVLVMDIDDEKLSLAHSMGAKTHNINDDDTLYEVINEFTNNNGVDAVLITANTKEKNLISKAAQISRKRGRIILVGVVGLDFKRDDFYEKELTFQVSCSYGPGRYDPSYEENGVDYPIGYVRWTEQRNFETVLNMMLERKIKIDHLLSHRFKLEDYKKAYDLLDQNKTRTSATGIILEYEADQSSINLSKTKIIKSNIRSTNFDNKINVGVIGSGKYLTSKLLPFLKNKKVFFNTISSKNGVSSNVYGKKYGFYKNTTEVEEIIEDKDINTVFIGTRHDTHADLVNKLLKKNKNIFVEKPLALNFSELELIKKNYANYNGRLMVGFNRRFSPLIKMTKQLLDKSETKKSFIYTINAGYTEPNNWVNNLKQGGGRIIGEVCHFIDLLIYLTNSFVKDWHLSNLLCENNDVITVSLIFENGSIGSIHYFSNGNNKYQKERLEIFSGKKILQLNNFKNLYGYGWKSFKKNNLWQQNKGQKECISAFIDSIYNKSETIPFEELIHVSSLAIEISENIYK